MSAEVRRQAAEKRPHQHCQEPRGWCYDPLGLTTWGHREGCLSHPTWGQHCWHSESDCCVCSDNPCGRVDVAFALAHERREAKRLAAAERTIDYAIAHALTLLEDLCKCMDQGDCPVCEVRQVLDDVTTAASVQPEASA